MRNQITTALLNLIGNGVRITDSPGSELSELSKARITFGNLEAVVWLEFLHDTFFGGN
jgi:hypothetical protein